MIGRHGTTLAVFAAFVFLLIPGPGHDVMATLPAFAQSNVVQTIRYGEVVSLRKVTYRDQSTGTGARVGATAGAVAGYALAGRRDRWLGGLLGGVIGGAAGGAIERAGK